MAEKVVVKLKKNEGKVHVSCVEFGIEEYCATEEEAIKVVEEKLAPKHLDIEYVRDYVEKD
ncbi:hypothetical protein [Hippea alviniae]|uniref:hypothetical protein n=1 Tax=Hippea alviniae TaxID=1279027 RepID=UPI0003B6F693|nr:hypothetical protein [Hippea alviniae]